LNVFSFTTFNFDGTLFSFCHFCSVSALTLWVKV
jgi:hypothetical protein